MKTNTAMALVKTLNHISLHAVGAPNVPACQAILAEIGPALTVLSSAIAEPESPAPNKAGADIVEYMDGAVGFVEADSFARHKLWEENKASKSPLDWTQVMSGVGFTIGMIGKRPVAISINSAIISGRKVLFIEATSQLVDWLMIGNWLELNLPKSAFEDGRFFRVDAQNAHIMYSRIRNAGK